MSSFLLGQCIGIVAVLFSLAVYQTDQRRKMLSLAAIAAILYACSFFLLHAYTGAALNLIGGIRCYLFMKSKSAKDSLLVFGLFASISSIAAYLTWVGPLSLLALAGTISSSISGGQLSTKWMRRAGLLAPPLWFSYNLIIRSYPGMFIELFVLASNAIGQYRFDFRSPRERSTLS